MPAQTPLHSTPSIRTAPAPGYDADDQHRSPAEAAAAALGAPAPTPRQAAMLDALTRDDPAHLDTLRDLIDDIVRARTRGPRSPGREPAAVRRLADQQTAHRGRRA